MVYTFFSRKKLTKVRYFFHNYIYYLFHSKKLTVEYEILVNYLKI